MTARRRLEVVAVLAVAAAACRQQPAPTPAPPPSLVGRASCEECHAAEVEGWRGSHHDRAMEPADASTVLGNFDGATFKHFGVTSTFTKKDGKYSVRTDGADGTLREFEIAYTFGIDPLQQYLIRFPGGRIQALNVCWDTRPKEAGGQRWFHLYPKEAVPHTDVLHWTGIYQNWNAMCAECHSTGVKKGYDAAKDTYDTTWFEIDVSCEACHGPGSNHVAWAKGQGPGYADLGLAVRLGERSPARWVMDPASGIAKRAPARSSRAEVETCGRCHARRGVVSEDYVHGRPLMDTHRVALLEPELYYADGQILEEDYEYGSFLQSKMYASGVTCTDCHDPHTGKTIQGNGTCAKCHLPAKYDTPSHHHHEMSGSAALCTSCHMPTRNYMVVHARHDHGFKVPRPDLTAATHAPDVCSGCHANKAAGWAGRKNGPHWSETIAAGRADPVAAAPALSALVGDTKQPGIVRATAAALGSPVTMLPALSTALGDADPLVRDAAVQVVAEAEPQIRARLLTPLTQDPVRTVRIDAGRALARVPGGGGAAASALAEWIGSQRYEADRPEARLNLCVLQAELGDFTAAETECRAAMRLAPGVPTVYVNLADVYRAAGREEDARATLRSGLAIAPDNAALWHSLGLAFVRERRPAEALDALRKASELDPGNARFAEVYRIARSELAPAR